jgi:hypothetical protein
MGLEQLVACVGPIVEPLLSDVCDLEDVRYKNVAGEEVRDDAATVIYPDIRCSFETMSKKHMDMFPAGQLSTATSHFLTFIKTETTLKIQPNFIIRVHAKTTAGNVVGHGELVFEQPGRADYSFSPLVGVGAVLRNQ